jgi:tetratricopeptide (TPR) repeat protein
MKESDGTEAMSNVFAKKEYAFKAMKSGDWFEALKSLKEIVSLLPVDTVILRAIIDVDLELKNFKDALSTAESLVSLDRASYSSNERYFKVLIQCQDYVNLIDFFDNKLSNELKRVDVLVYFYLRACQFTCEDQKAINAIRGCSIYENIEKSEAIFLRGIALSSKYSDKQLSEKSSEVLKSLGIELKQDTHSLFNSIEAEIYGEMNSAKSIQNKTSDFRVALCFSGQARGYREAFDKINKNIILPLKPDVFISTWDSVGIKKTINNRVALQRILYKDLSDLIPQKIVDTGITSIFNSLAVCLDKWNQAESVVSALNSDLTQLYSPKAIQIHSESEYDAKLLENGIVKSTHMNQSKMKFMILNANKLKKLHETKAGLDYDLVIRLRLDKAINRPISISKDFKDIIQDTVFVDHISYHGIGDQFAYSNTKVMDFYSAMGPVYDRHINSKKSSIISGLAGHSVIRELFLRSPYNLSRPKPFIGGELMNIKISINDLLENGFKKEVLLNKEYFSDKELNLLLSFIEENQV